MEENLPTIAELLKDNPYPGRGIVAGLSENSAYAVCAYFIMGRSENSRNRVFAEEGDGLRTAPFDASKMKDPSLIIYRPVRSYKNCLIVTNGDQTDTIYEFLKAGKSFEDALLTRAFEPDAPNFTPRISALLHLEKDFHFQMSILKAANPEGTVCERQFFKETPKPGCGRLIHTYEHDGSPLPSFAGSPKALYIPNSIEEFSNELWESLDKENKISLFVRYLPLCGGQCETRIFNKNQIEKRNDDERI